MMLLWTECSKDVLCHNLVPAGPIPTIGDPDGIYPYESYCETSRRPSFRSLKSISIENEYLKVEICPDLGGGIQSIFHKGSQKEVLFQPWTVRPTRILPRMGFNSGGIENSFPISHSPVRLETVSYKVEQISNRLYVWCGEQELRYGMQWTVEYSLGESDKFLTQRSLYYNPTSHAHPWMAWSNAAVPASTETRFFFPKGNVLYHGNELKKIDWENEGPKTLKDIDRMAGFFWETAACNAFGVFNPSEGCGLYHVANPTEVPGIKLWVYGKGGHEKWSHLSTMEKASYLEIQASPLKDQSIMEILAPKERHVHTEFWIPTCEPLDIAEIKIPSVELVIDYKMPLFGWVERPKTYKWLKLLLAYCNGQPRAIPEPPAGYANEWPPSGMDELGNAITWAISVSEPNSEFTGLWSYYLAVWYAGRGEKDAALSILGDTDCDWASLLEGRLLRYWNSDPVGAAKSLSRIQCRSLALHPQVVIERDIILSLLESKSLPERAEWLRQVNSLQDDGLAERTIQFLLDSGKAEEALQLMETTNFEPVHQRYVRTKLWNDIHESLERQTRITGENLGEDDLAQFGLYRSYEDHVK